MSDVASTRIGPVRPPVTMMARVWQTILDRGLGTMSLLGGLVAWEAVGWIFGAAWLPPFSGVIRALIDLTLEGRILVNLMNSLRSLFVGFSIALGGGLVVGALMGRYRYVYQALDPYVYALFVSPTMIFIPVFFAIFGLAGGTRIAIIVVYGIFVIIINTATALRTVDTSLIEMARSYGASERQLFLRVLIPASLPLVFAGIQLGMGRSVKGMINGEMFIALVGLGALSQRFGGRFEAESAMAIALVILLVALVFNMVVRMVDRRLTYWTE
jgi:NitT/TauT family transport system permease protein